MLFNKFFRFRPAMTLAEVLITIGVIGVIASILLPVIIRSIPSRNETKMKKMTYVIEQVVTQLYADDIMYPKSASAFDEGFQNTEKVTINGVTYGGNINSSADGEKPRAQEKFCRLFATKFNISGDLKCAYDEDQAIVAMRDDKYPNEVGGYASGTHGVVPTFTSVDGVEWYLHTYKSDGTTKPFDVGYEKLVIDVNGPEGPNCIEGGKGADATGNEIAACSKKQADRFVYYIRANGTVSQEKPTSMTRNGKVKLNLIQSGDCGTACKWRVAKLSDTVVDAETGRTQEDFTALNAASWGNKTSVDVDIRSKYIIEAKPSNDYISPWQMNRRRVIINNTDATVTIPFKKRDTRCVAIKVDNCPESNAKNCINLSLKGECYYEECSNDQCPYDYDSDGAYNYVGVGKSTSEDSSGNKISWKYKCDGSDKSSNAKPGIPEYNKDETLKYDDAGNIKLSQTDGAVYICGLVADNYMLEASGKGDYTVTNGTTQTCTDGTMVSKNKYSQDIKLGPSNLLFTVRVGTGVTTTCPTE